MPDGSTNRLTHSILRMKGSQEQHPLTGRERERGTRLRYGGVVILSTETEVGARHSLWSLLELRVSKENVLPDVGALV